MSDAFVPDKPFKTYKEMLDLLESRNVIIQDRDEAEEVLASISYYTLINGYKHLFTFDSNDSFHPPVYFNEFRYLQSFDITINNLLFKYIILVENSLKSHMSYIISKKYGVWTDLNTTDPLQMIDDDYLSRNHYQRNHATNGQISRIKNFANTSEIASVKHYRDMHNHMPCWILIKSLPFGQTIKWFGLFKGPDKGYVCHKIIGDTSLPEARQKEFVIKGLQLLKEYRNNIAHGNIVFTSGITIQLPKPSVLTLAKELITESDYNRGLGRNDLLATIIAISVFLPKDDRTIFINEITVLFSQYERVVFSNGKDIYQLLNLPHDLPSRLNQFKQPTERR